MKNFRAARPRAKWKIDAPTIMVLSQSKKAAAVGSDGTTALVAAAWEAAAALAAPATMVRTSSSTFRSPAAGAATAGENCPAFGRRRRRIGVTTSP